MMIGDVMVRTAKLLAPDVLTSNNDPSFTRERETQNVRFPICIATCRRELPSLLCPGHVFHTFESSASAHSIASPCLLYASPSP